MFFYGEDSVTDNLSPYIDAAPKHEQKYFLATQQVDEARHAVFFHRFFNEVIGAGDSISSTLAYTEAQLGWGYRNVFERLDRMADDLRRDRSLPNFARAIALYHMVVEATLAQPGPALHRGLLREGRDDARLQRRDGQRLPRRATPHRFRRQGALRDASRSRRSARQAVAELLREVMPYSLAVFSPPNWDREYTRCYGFELEDIFAFGLRSVRDQVARDRLPDGGDAAASCRSTRRSPPRRSPRARSCCSRPGSMGEPNGRPESSPEVQRALLRHHRPLGRHDAVDGGPLTIQWRFADADPWHLRIDNGSTAAAPGAGRRRRPHHRDQLARLDRRLPRAGTRAGRCSAAGCARAARCATC